MKLLRGKDVKVNGKRVNVDCLCRKGDLIEVYVKEKPCALQTVYSDNNVAVLVKKQGISCEDFLARVKEFFPSAEAVHRLDVNTSGIMIFALNGVAKEELDYGFKNRTFKKYYLAEVYGVPKQPVALLTAYLKKDAEKSTVYVHDQKHMGDLEIKTKYELISSSGNTALLQVELITGRTHQIRAHLAHVGLPIIGDDKYGNREVNKKYGCYRQRLTSCKLVLYFNEKSPLYYLNGKVFETEGAIK